MTAYPETCLVDCEDGHRTMLLLESPSDADTETGALARLTVVTESGETIVRLSPEAVDMLIDRLRELRTATQSYATIEDLVECLRELRGEGGDTRDDRAAQVVPELPELPRVELRSVIDCADEGDTLSAEAREDGLPLLWMRTEGEDRCVALDDAELLELAALCIAHWRERQGKRD